MNRNTLIALAAITLTVVITAIVVVSKERAPTYLDKKPLLPTLQENINKAASISLVSNRHKTILERDGETWRIANSDDYPALFEKVRNLLINLSELHTLERKTNKPELYHYLNVQAPSQPDSNSVQVTVMDEGANILADVIIGKPRTSKVTNIQTGLYVREPDSSHALLVEGRVPVAAEKTAWFNPNILNIASERIREVVVKHPDGNIVRAFRDSPESNFQLADLPDNRKVQSQVALNRFGSVLQDISARDIRALGNFNFERPVETTVYTFNGMIIDVRSSRLDDRHYANFQFRFDVISHRNIGQPLMLPETDTSGKQASPQEQAQELQARLGNWVYQIPGYQFDNLTATLEDYTREIAAPAAEAN